MGNDDRRLTGCGRVLFTLLALYLAYVIVRMYADVWF